MATKKQGKDGAFIALILGGILAFAGLAIMQRASPAENGVTTTATVVDVEGRDRGVGAERRPQIRVVYGFEDASGDYYTFDTGWRNRPNNTPDTGDEETISYNSEDPSDAKLSSGSSTVGRLVLGLGVVSLLAGGGWMLNSRRGKDPEPAA